MTMKRIYDYIFVCLIAFVMGACTQEELFQTQITADKDSGIKISLSFPEMGGADTRTLGDNPSTTLDKMDIYLFLFDGTHLLQTIHIPTNDETRKYESGILSFTANLPQTDKNATLHIIALDDSDRVFANQINDVGYGIEDSVMPSYWLGDGKDAYWARVELGCRVVVTVSNADNDLDNVVGTEDQIEAKFQNPVPLVRNFAKISMTNNTPTATNFKILAWTVVNERDRGSVVPWYSPSSSNDVNYPEYTYFNDTEGKNITRSYEELTEHGNPGVNYGYHGVSQAGALFKTTIVNIGNYDSGNWTQVEANNQITTSRYLYERKVSSVDPLYILVYGDFNGDKGYYKLALGYTDHNSGLFTEYNVIRNIAYEIKINSVTTKGFSTPAEAAAGPASNNISGDVVTRNLFRISDGVAMLYVNFINYVVTSAEESVDFKYKFVPNIKNPKVTSNNDVFFNVEGIGIAEGDVIKSYKVIKNDDETLKTEDGWSTIHIEFNNPSDDLKLQSFTIFTTPDYATDGSLPEENTMGLSRTINFVLRNPWKFVRMETFPGHISDSDSWPHYDPDSKLQDNPDVNYHIGKDIGSPLTIFYELPDGLPEAIFPLEFTFESDRQNIENAGVGTAVVQFGPSLFSGVYDYRISYVKTLEWSDYAKNNGETSTAESRIQRARFLTTTNITSLNDPAYITTVRLHNPYFIDKDDKFIRDQNQSATPPSN